jgi:SAM-dependent methyltransferase
MLVVLLKLSIFNLYPICPSALNPLPMNRNYSLYAKYYNLLYRDKDYEAEGAYVCRLIKRYAPHARKILELGAGTGKHAQILCRKGFTVHGIDQSEEMLLIAEDQRIEGLTLERAEISSFLGAKRYDVALSLFHVISYLTDSDTLIKTFKNISQQLNPGGVFIFDVWHTEAVYAQYPEERTKEMSDDAIRVTRRATPEVHLSRNVVDVNYDVCIEDLASKEESRFHEKHSMRHFSRTDIETFAEFSDFEVLHTEEFLTGKNPGSDTWSVCYVLKKTRI